MAFQDSFIRSRAVLICSWPSLFSSSNCTTTLSAANSRIKDVDVAAESTQFAKSNILVQSGTAMLAQANLMPQSALRLISQ